MSSVTSSAPLSLIWRGTWQASGVNSNGYQRYDCVSHTVTSPTTRTDIYFAVTEIASGGAEPNPTSGQTTWKVLLEGGTIAASDGSIVYHDAEGNNVLVQAAADRILEVVNGIPEFVQRDPAPVATFEGYRLPSSPPNRMISTQNAYWISGDRVFGLGTMWEGFMAGISRYQNITERPTPTPVLFTPRDDDAQVPIGKIFHGYRCMFAIGKDDKSKVYGIGLNAGRFGDGTNDITTFVYDVFQKIQYFEDNSINIEHVFSSPVDSANTISVLDTTTTNVGENNIRNFYSIAYFIQEVVDVGGVDTGGNVYVSAYSGGTNPNGSGGATRDGTVQAITGFDQPIIGGYSYSSATFFWSKRKVYGFGGIIITAGGGSTTSSTVTELTAAGSFVDTTQVGFSSDIVHFSPNLNDTAFAITLADGTAYWYNYKSPSAQRTTTLFEQLPVISGKLYRKVVAARNALTTIAIMDDNSAYLIGRYYEGTTTRTAASLTEIEFPYDIEIEDAYHNRNGRLVLITTDGDVIVNSEGSEPSMIQHTNYTMNISFDGNNMTLYTDPGWVGRATDLTFSFASASRAFSIQTEDGYIYTSNTLGNAVDQDDTSLSRILENVQRPIGVNFQHQVYYANSTTSTVTANSYDYNLSNAGTGIASTNTRASFSVTINGSMIQRPTLRSYQVT